MDLFSITSNQNAFSLSRASNNDELKRYFAAILELSKSGEQFPVDLDDVWMLIYGRKEEAVRALTVNDQFLQGVDYQVLRKNAENPNGGRPTNIYKLSVSCMEYFIARKVRSVFEVYRQVFHGVANNTYQIPQSFAEALMLAAKQQEAIEAQQRQIEVKDKKIQILTDKVKTVAPKVSAYDTYISSDGTFTATQIAKEYGWGAETLNKRLKERGVQYKQNGQWLLSARYDGHGYTKSIPRTYTHRDGRTGTQMQTVWTSKGREFIHSIFKETH